MERLIVPTNELPLVYKLMLLFMSLLPFLFFIVLIMIIYRRLKRKNIHWILYLLVFLMLFVIAINFYNYLCGEFRYLPRIRFGQYCKIY